MSEWQPIETAPKDGTKILVHGPMKEDPATATPHDRTYTEVCPWYLGRWTVTWKVGHGEPTHWMPLPDPPEAAK